LLCVRVSDGIRCRAEEASIDVESLAVIAGALPPRPRRLVAEWATAHRAELRDNWARAREHRPL